MFSNVELPFLGSPNRSLFSASEVLSIDFLAYRTGEIPAQSHVHFGGFFRENPRKRSDAKVLMRSPFIARNVFQNSEFYLRGCKHKGPL